MNLQPKEFFTWLEPDDTKRSQLINTIKLVMNPRTNYKSIVIVRHGSRFIRNIIMNLIDHLVDSAIVSNFEGLLKRNPYTNEPRINIHIYEKSLIHFNNFESIKENPFDLLITYLKDPFEPFYSNHHPRFTCWFMFDEDIFNDELEKKLSNYEEFIIYLDISPALTMDDEAIKQVRYHVSAMMQPSLVALKTYIMNYYID